MSKKELSGWDKLEIQTAAVRKMEALSASFEVGSNKGETEVLESEPEFELKFLVDSECDEFRAILSAIEENRLKHKQLIQRYFEYEGQKFRLRKSESSQGKVQFALNTKTGEKPFRQEHKLSLDEETFELLWEGMPATGNIIEKIRYEEPYTFVDANGITQAVTIELDIFAGRLEGLILAEVEFPEPDQALAGAQMAAFQQNCPDWLAVDVTMLSGFGNNALSQADSIEEVQQRMLEKALTGPARRVTRLLDRKPE